MYKCFYKDNSQVSKTLDRHQSPIYVLQCMGKSGLLFRNGFLSSCSYRSRDSATHDQDVQTEALVAPVCTVEGFSKLVEGLTT